MQVLLQRKICLWVIAVMLLGCAVRGSAATASKAKVRTKSGIIQESMENTIVLKVGKEKQLSIQVTDRTQVYGQTAGNVHDLYPDALVQVSGKGRENRIKARKIMLLPMDSLWSMFKKKKKGDAYPGKERSTQVKGKILTTDPLVIMNRSQQKVGIDLLPNHTVVKRTKAGRTELLNGKRVKVTYRESDGMNTALEIIVLNRPNTDSK